MKTYEPPDGNMSTVGAKCFRCAEVLLQSEAIRGLFAAGEVVGDAHGNNRLSVIFLWIAWLSDAWQERRVLSKCWTTR